MNRALLDGESLDGVSGNSAALLKVLEPSQAQTSQELTEVFWIILGVLSDELFSS